MRSRGFTLLEVLVSVFVFGIVAMLAYGGYNQLTRQSDEKEERDREDYERVAAGTHRDHPE